VTQFTAYDFIRKWKPVALTERATAQEHFLDLCRLFGHPSPAEDDPIGERFTFEKGVSKTGGGEGFADVWKKGFFAWEYKKKRRDLGKALEQLTRYAAALENPPLHVACDTHIFRIETRWTNEVPKAYEFELEDLAEPRHFETLRRVFFEPEKLKSGRDRQALTRDAADKFQAVSDSLQKRVAERETVAHFVNQLVFCFFAQSVGLLPPGLMRKLLQLAENKPLKSREFFKNLFDGMAKGGEVGFDELLEFNGGLFDGRDALGLQHNEIAILFQVSNLDWSLIDPTIFGTLFERFLDPDKRAQIGAHYTEVDKIKLIVEPVIERPLRREWAAAKAEIEAILAPLADESRPSPARAKKREAMWLAAAARRDAFIERLARLRILDPACGSGNFLYLALQAVKDIEYKAILDSEALGLPRVAPRIGPEILHGVEINPFAAELARTTIWIGDIQWRVKNAVLTHPRPILRKLDSIECRDALLTASGEEAEWPEADFIVGNPPFLGGKLLRRGLGDAYVEALFSAFAGKVPAEADLVCYWFSKAWRALEAGRAESCGLVATNSIRGGANRRVLEPMAEKQAIFEAWSDEAWTVDGAAVRVSLVMFAKESGDEARLDGVATAAIHADLGGASANLTEAKPLKENAKIGFMGDTKGGAFDIDGALARAWLAEPLNVNGRPNSDVLKPWVNGLDVTRRPRDMWIVDFGWTMGEGDAALYESPFRHALEKVKSERDNNRRDAYRLNWWRHVEARPAMWVALQKAGNAGRYIVTPTVAKHRLFVWIEQSVCPDHQLIAIARDDDTTFGVLHSRFHEAWSLRLGTWLGVGNDPRYTPTTTFETFPFPAGLTPNIPAASYADDPRARRIAEAARKLDQLRRNWLNPPDLVDIVPEVTPTAAPGEPPRRYPDRIVPKNAEAAAKLKSRTLTNLYNERPRWLADAHEALDRAVAAAYGWPEDIATEDALARLLALNAERAKG
jgi:type II restriction/modification system DNA methylase subunit YeeA